ncbi:hypothetical protein CHUAL_005282 [Chamberlinius hualienensis]
MSGKASRKHLYRTRADNPHWTTKTDNKRKERNKRLGLYAVGRTSSRINRGTAVVNVEQQARANQNLDALLHLATSGASHSSADSSGNVNSISRSLLGNSDIIEVSSSLKNTVGTPLSPECIEDADIDEETRLEHSVDFINRQFEMLYTNILDEEDKNFIKENKKSLQAIYYQRRDFDDGLFCDFSLQTDSYIESEVGVLNGGKRVPNDNNQFPSTSVGSGSVTRTQTSSRSLRLTGESQNKAVGNNLPVIDVNSKEITLSDKTLVNCSEGHYSGLRNVSEAIEATSKMQDLESRLENCSESLSNRKSFFASPYRPPLPRFYPRWLFSNPQ